MIEEVVNSILEAEDAARQRVAEAEREASEIVSAAEIEAESLKKNTALQNKAFLRKKMRQADELAEKQAADKLTELNVATDKEIAAYAKNIDKAVKIILESNK